MFCVGMSKKPAAMMEYVHVCFLSLSQQNTEPPAHSMEGLSSRSFTSQYAILPTEGVAAVPDATGIASCKRQDRWTHYDTQMTKWVSPLPHTPSVCEQTL